MTVGMARVATLALVVATTVACALPIPEAGGPEVGPPPPLLDVVDAMAWTEVAITTDEGTSVPLVVRVARTEAERAQGLQRVTALPERVGMLFLFPGEGTRGGFWMRDTLVPLDIAFLDAEGRIVTIAAMEPCVADPCPITDPGLPYAAALEVGAGVLARAGVAVGDVVSWPAPQGGTGPDA